MYVEVEEVLLQQRGEQPNAWEGGGSAGEKGLKGCCSSNEGNSRMPERGEGVRQGK